ncbi:MAG TPA: HEAT repeat domain-containing protein [Methanoculleus sp.]|jgi:HEAT repeat protein|uniref:HEAT repeat domain-containing protein n=1 Tax=Methanoculleus sp. TaxID=90427 RepID=UPI000B2357A0|nr:HEAT repeat domain-containing protein [Methanoculleus sp.]MBP7144813.1 HEAT repeat domain-containing protein [Methanoculleus sp.]HNQ32355.1 HEAT repeat domain-containing protein [Methanoculleus sp.]HNT07421.1 HEAT repeat domain-containing protein [Methanoculleus sp.]HNV38474.1 HEAT repeat domain-containing protein [Methanoculleus sp.]HOC84633.1 HEAT repeat domain-containing protein [Methanoculleus sp.]
MTHAMLPDTGDEHPRDLQPLLIRLFDPDKAVRAEAVHGLIAIGSPAVPACIALLQDADWRVRYRAAEVLGRIGDADAFAPLVAALGDEKDHVRYMAAKGLGLLCDPRAIAHLGVMQRDENEFVRRGAAGSLGRIGGAKAVGLLHAALGDEATEGVRAAILAALRDAGAEGT